MIPLYPAKMPFFIKWFFPKLIYRHQNNEKRIYLTFDDGPNPEVTPWVLNLLKQEQIKATFFCVGNQIEKYPKILKQVVAEGHQIGNHSYRHENGWHTPVEVYKESIENTKRLIAKNTSVSSQLFRPPYGRITPKQIKILKQSGYKIIMWSLLSGDFSSKLKQSQALYYLKKLTHPGEIIVFHDSRKAFKNLKKILPGYIKYLKEKGYIFDLIE